MTKLTAGVVDDLAGPITKNLAIVQAAAARLGKADNKQAVLDEVVDAARKVMAASEELRAVVERSSV